MGRCYRIDCRRHFWAHLLILVFTVGAQIALTTLAAAATPTASDHRDTTLSEGIFRLSAGAPTKLRVRDIKSIPTPIEWDKVRLSQMGVGDDMDLRLPSGEVHRVVIDRIDQHGEGIRSTVGYLRGLGKDYRVILTTGPGGTFGSIRTPKSRWQIVPGGSTDLLVDLDEEYKFTPRVSLGTDYILGERHEEHTHEETTPSWDAVGKATPLPNTTLAEPTPQVTVDIMFVYTRGLAENLGVNLLPRFYQLIATANTAYQDSEVAVRLRLVNATMVDYPDTGSDASALQAIRPNGSGDHAPFTNVYAIRNAIGADLVAFMRNGGTNSGSGIATLTLNTVTGGPEGLYSVVTGCVAGCDSVFAHEIGHNMGNAHDRATAAAEQGGTPTPTSGAFPYSFGNFGCASGGLTCNPFVSGGCGVSEITLPTCTTANNNNFGTIMSYFDPEILKFSNPAITCTSPGGASRACGVADSVDNARSMNNMRFVIRDARPTVVVSLPGALQLAASRFEASEAGGTAVVTVSRLGGTAGMVSVSYATQDGNAKAGFDYLATSGTLVWADGDMADKVINVPIFGEGVTEGAEAFSIALSNPTGAVGVFLGYPSSASVLITENVSWPPGGSFPVGFTTSASASLAWTTAADTAFEGATSLRSARIIGNGVSFTTSPVSISGIPGGLVSFAYRVSTYGGVPGIFDYGFFEFLVNGTVVLTETGESGWKTFSYTLPAGSNTLTWQYRNSLPGFCNSGFIPPPPGGANCADRAWIDAVSLPTTLSPSSTLLASSSNPSLTAASVTLTASITGGAGAPTGVVTFLDGGVVIPSCQFVSIVAGSAACTTASFSQGIHTLSALYSGSSVYDVSTSNTVMQTVNASSLPLTITKSSTGGGTVTSNIGGINCGATCSANYASGISVTLTATPAVGSTFGGWSGGGCGTINPCLVNVLGTTSVNAQFDIAATAPGAPTLTAAVAGNGQATVTFTAPASNGGSPITNYTATCDGSSATGAFSPIVVSALANNVAVNCVVTATNNIGTGPQSNGLMVTPTAGATIALDAVFSRKTHAGAGAFDIVVDSNQPIGGAVTVEPRVIGTGHQIVFLFNVPVTGVGSSSASLGAATHTFSGNEVVVNVTGITDNQRATVSVTGVTGAVGNVNASASLGFLVGDISSSRTVTAADISAVKARSNQAVTATTARYDLNLNGTINSVDVSAAKARAGVGLP